MMIAVMSKQSYPQPNNPGWLIQVPLDDLVALQKLPQQMQQFQQDNEKLRRELEALRCIQSEMMELFGDFRRELRRR